MSIWNKLFGREKVPESGPFMEHPTGDFDSAITAMQDAIRRLRALPNWEEWITFCAQGEGSENTYQFAEIRMLHDALDVGDKPLDIVSVVENAGTKEATLVAVGGHYSIAAASPLEAARILDSIFRTHLGLRPFPDEDDDYAVGAEF